MSDGKVRIVPLGGLGEIGLNLMIVEFCPAGSDRTEAIAVDCGLMFPEQQMLGIDVVVPDFTYIRQIDSLRAVVLTHGHEDHIGALPHLLREFNVPVYGTRFTIGLVRDKLGEHGLLESANLHEYRPREVWEIGPFTIEGIHVTHSIVDASALAITTPLGTILHTGDFRFDYTPIDGRKSDLDRLAEIGEAGVLLLLSDSTNVDREGTTGSERSITLPIEDLISNSRGKVLVATFASHILRIRQVMELSAAQGRLISIVGRRLVNNIGIAEETGHLPVQSEAIIDVASVRDRDPKSVTLLTTGSQGEPLSALSRIASGMHKQVTINSNDTVILSSRVIPGNEKTIARLIDDLNRRGADVHYEAVACVHVSGHAAQDELRLMLRLVRPQYFVPIHGEYRFLMKHCELARESGLDPNGVFLLEDGQVLEIDASGASEAGSVEAGRVFVDGLSRIQDEVLRDRRQVAREGFIIAIIGLDHQTGEILSGQDILSRGFLSVADGKGYDGAKAAILIMLEELPRQQRSDSDVVKEQLRLVVRRYFRRTLGRRPVVLPFVMEM